MAGWAVVTGASSGIGEALALRLAGRGHPVALVARRRDRLVALAGRLGTEVLVIVEDLASDGAAARVVSALGDRPVEVLINNAGKGALCAFDKLPAAEVATLLRLNVVAPTELTHALLPGMLARGRGRVVNLSSLSAFFDVPGLSLYGATKQYVLGWSLALDAETRGRGVTVTAVCPGPVDTEFNGAAQIDVPSPKGLTVSADAVATDALAAMDAGTPLSVPHFAMKAGAAFSRWLPRSLAPRLARQLMRLSGVARAARLE